MDLTDDTAAFFTDFAIDATVAGVPVRGIFDAAYADVLGLVAGSTPVLTCASRDVTEAAVGASVTINATVYTVAEVHPDGTGMTRLLLK